MSSLLSSYMYECEARVTIPKAMNVWCFPDIVFYYGSNDFIIIVNLLNDWLICSHIPWKYKVNFERS